MLIGEDEEQTLLHLAVTQYSVQLLSGLFYALTVLAVDDEYQTLSASVVVPPKRPDFVLSSNIPNVELDVLICHSLDIEAH